MDGETQLLALVQSGWAQLMGLFGIAWWARKIDLRSQDAQERLNRHEARLSQIETAQQGHALQMARMEEMLSAIKLTLDRMYAEMRDRGAQ